MRTALLIIGDEILSGNVLDTNSNFASRLLFSNNIPVSQILAVADTEEAIKEGIGFLFGKADLVITTGGLGPTKDDVTKAAITSYFHSELVFNNDIYEELVHRYTRRGKPLNDLNKAQAMVPAVAEIITNTVGTAPVFWIEQNGHTLITLPGVPSEMRFLLEHVLLSRLTEKFLSGVVVQKTLHVVGIAESELAIQLEPVELKIGQASTGQVKYKLAYLPDLNVIRLQVTGVGADKKVIEQQVGAFCADIQAIAGQYIFGAGNETLASHVGSLLNAQHATISTAESCTGGYLAHLITLVPGSSAYYTGSIISYANVVKENELGVKPETLEQYGAVSEETCREMLAGCLKKFGTGYALATTGIAGPTGDTEDKPVGLVWIGVANADKMVVKSYHFNRSRQDNIHLFAVTALDMLRKLLNGQY